MAWRRGFQQSPPPYYRELLISARSLCDRGDHTLAVITAFMACELLTEQAMGWMYQVRGAEFLEAPVAEFIASYNLANERVRRLYNALSLENIQKVAFWQAFAKLARARNELVHGARKGTQEDALEGLEAAEQLVRHLVTTMQLLPKRVADLKSEVTGNGL